MPGAGGARVVQNSGCWTCLRLVPTLLYRSCFFTALCLTSSTQGSYGYLSAVLLLIMYREYLEQRMSFLARLTQQHTVKSAVVTDWPYL